MSHHCVQGHVLSPSSREWMEREISLLHARINQLCPGTPPLPVVTGTLREHLEKALACLMEQHQHEDDPHGPRGTGLRAQAIAHVRYALILSGPESA